MIAITGAAGFIGSNLAHRLAELGNDLLLVDNAPPSTPNDNWAGLKGYSFVEQKRFLEDLAKNEYRPHVIFHLGACSSTTETNWDYLKSNNIGYSQTLWNWCAKHQRPLLYASSAATYGDGSRGFDDRTRPEELAPLNLYGKSKNDFDAWVLAQIAAGQPTPPHWAGLKFFNVYGPREAHKGSMASMVYHSHKQILQTGEVKLFKSNDPDYPDGGQRRDFVYVGDCVNHMIWLWQKAKPAALYNSGTGTPRTFHELAVAVFAALKREPKIRFIDMPANLAQQYQNFTQADISKLKELGYPESPTTLEAGVQATVDWLEQQRS